MQLPLMHSKQKLTAVHNPLFLSVLSIIVFSILIVLNFLLYSGVISMNLQVILFAFLFSWNISIWFNKNKSFKHRWVNVWITVLVLSFQVLSFCIFLPNFTYQKAATIIEHSYNEEIRVVENYTIDTLDRIAPFINKCYVFSCIKIKTNQIITIAFDPVNGSYYEIKS